MDGFDLANQAINIQKRLTPADVQAAAAQRKTWRMVFSELRWGKYSKIYREKF